MLGSLDTGSRGGQAYPPMALNFAISQHDIAGGLQLVCRGELDLAAVPRAEEELRGAVREYPLVILDLHELEFMDSSGLQLILRADRLAGEFGHRLVLVGIPPQVRRLLELTRCDEHLTILEDPAVRRR